MGRYPAHWGGSGGEASRVQGLPWGHDTIHFPTKAQHSCSSFSYQPSVSMTISVIFLDKP